LEPPRGCQLSLNRVTVESGFSQLGSTEYTVLICGEHLYRTLVCHGSTFPYLAKRFNHLVESA
jgi:hypothetical protein